MQGWRLSSCTCLQNLLKANSCGLLKKEIACTLSNGLDAYLFSQCSGEKLSPVHTDRLFIPLILPSSSVHHDEAMPTEVPTTRVSAVWVGPETLSMSYSLLFFHAPAPQGT